MTYRARLAVAGALATVLLAPTPAVASTSSPSSGAPFTITREKGHVLDCSGEHGGVHVAVQLYDNSAFGTHASLNVRTADTQYLRGGETDAGLFNNGTLSRTLVVDQQGEAAGPSQTAVINGSYTPAGPRQRVHVVHDEPWGQVVSKGWKTPLSAAVTVQVLGQRVDLTCDNAFAFDNRVWRLVFNES
ncbi:hypothetical protein ACFYMI_20805 [Streptomyces collinus]|jgi:hypothetical protein|uniref:hypothetical protein n=1 Tax=Streptomyces collinus TaxID=42684 RepID=UPI0036CED443